jgi:hypothetical protein
MEQNNCYKIYKHVFPDGSWYIGQTNQHDPNNRFLNGNGYKDNQEFFNKIEAEGWDKVKSYLLFDNLLKKEADGLENYLIRTETELNPNTLNKQFSKAKVIPKRIPKQVKTPEEKEQEVIAKEQRRIAHKERIAEREKRRLEKEREKKAKEEAMIKEQHKKRLQKIKEIDEEYIDLEPDLILEESWKTIKKHSMVGYAGEINQKRKLLKWEIDFIQECLKRMDNNYAASFTGEELCSIWETPSSIQIDLEKYITHFFMLVCYPLSGPGGYCKIFSSVKNTLDVSYPDPLREIREKEIKKAKKIGFFALNDAWHRYPRDEKTPVLKVKFKLVDRFLSDFLNYEIDDSFDDFDNEEVIT